MPYQEELKALAPLMTFDPGVFRGDEKAPPAVCNLVLALAVAYNDLRDVAFGLTLLQQSRPSGEPRPSREFGQFGGLKASLDKAMVGVIHETLNLIARESAAADHPFFRRVVTSCSPTARSAWASLVAAANGEVDAQPLSRALMLMRNKVAFHYDAKGISRAFAESFLGPDQAMEPYVSRGNSMRATRFYFADRAVESYLHSHVTADGEQLFFQAGGDIALQVAWALHEIVTRFVPARGAGWRPQP